MVSSQDSLWAAEDIEAVFDRDPQRVCILQGPVAVKHSLVKDEPIKDLLDTINSSLIEKLLHPRYGGDTSRIPSIDYLAATPVPNPQNVLASFDIQRDETDAEISYTLGNAIPEPSLWLETLAGPELGWLRALLCSPIIVQDTSYIDNPVRRLLAPRSGQKVVVALADSFPLSVTVYGAARSYSTHKKTFKAVEIRYEAASKMINVTIFEDRRDVSVPLQLQFIYQPSMGSAPIHEVAVGRNARIKEFYWRLWYGDEATLQSLDIRDTFTGPEITIDVAAVETFCGVVGNQGESFTAVRSPEAKAPMDFAIVTGWQASPFLGSPSSLCVEVCPGHHKVNISVRNRRRPAQARSPLEWLPHD